MIDARSHDTMHRVGGVAPTESHLSHRRCVCVAGGGKGSEGTNNSHSLRVNSRHMKCEELGLEERGFNFESSSARAA